MLSLFLASCSTPAEVAVPTTTTDGPRQVAPDETVTSTTTTSTTTTSTTTTTEPPPPPPVAIDALGAIRTVPLPDTDTDTDTEDEDEDATAEEPEQTGPTVFDNDATLATLGCTSSTGCAPTDLATFAANQIDVINLATSEAAADGTEVLGEYQAALISTGVATVGYGENLEQATTPVVLGPEGRLVAIYSISFTPELDTDLVASETTAGIAAGDEALARILERVRTSIDGGEKTIIMVDWGQTDDRAPTEAQIEWAQAFVDAEANVIIGYGSDFLQRFERIPPTAVAFNLGNAVTLDEEPLRRDTAVLHVSFTEEAEQTCLLPAVGGELGITLDNPAETDCNQ